MEQRQAFSELLAETEALRQTNAEYKRTLTNKNKENEKLEHMVRYSREEADTIKDSLLVRDSEINKLNNQLEVGEKIKVELQSRDFVVRQKSGRDIG